MISPLGNGSSGRDHIDDCLDDDRQYRDGHGKDEDLPGKLHLGSDGTLPCIPRDMCCKFSYIGDSDDLQDRLDIHKVHVCICCQFLKHVNDGIDLINEEQKDRAADKNDEQEGKVRLLFLDEQGQEGRDKCDSDYLDDLNRRPPLSYP